MSGSGNGILDKMLHHRYVQHWAQAAQNADQADADLLRLQRGKARVLKGHLDALLHKAEERLALPYVGSNAFQKPHNTEWAWRPEMWRGPLPVPGMSSVTSNSKLGGEVTLFHDCPHSEITLRQIRNQREEDLAPYGMRLDVFRFTGSYMSIVVDLPEQAIVGLKRSHLIRLSAIAEVESSLEIYARLNIRNGPNTEQIVRKLPLDRENTMVEFDLAYSDLNERRVESAWVDLIFEGPAMNQVTLRDVTFLRRPRAAL